jgi:hypothetical protein
VKTLLYLPGTSIVNIMNNCPDRLPVPCSLAAGLAVLLFDIGLKIARQHQLVSLMLTAPNCAKSFAYF